MRWQYALRRTRARAGARPLRLSTRHRIRRTHSGLPGDRSDACRVAGPQFRHLERWRSTGGVLSRGESPRSMSSAPARPSIDRARSTARGNEDEALNLWQGLVAGRWSLIEQFDSDGRRFIVARRNDPHVTDPRALGLRERQVLSYVAMGHPAKLIAYSLGVSPSSVSTTRRTAMRKLGLKTTADIVRLFASAAPDAAQER
jgi:DNA-binding CsgD family transcriptional regulator